MKTKEQELMIETKKFAESIDIRWSNPIATMVLNAYREGVKNGFESCREKVEEGVKKHLELYPIVGVENIGEHVAIEGVLETIKEVKQ